MTGINIKQLFALILMLMLSGCYGEITGLDLAGQPTGTNPNDYDSTAPGFDQACYGEGIATPDEECTVSADCNSPLVCVQGQCLPTMGEGIYCDPLDGKTCPNPNDVCAAGLCTTLPDQCRTSAECPTDYRCARIENIQVTADDKGMRCKPARESTQCSDTSGGPNLVGTWKMTNQMNLLEGVEGIAGQLLKLGEKTRDAIQGTWGGSFIEQIGAAFLSSVIQSYVPQWATDFAGRVGDIANTLENAVVESTVKVDATDCKGTYRGTQTWDAVVVTMRGVEVRIKPEEIPNVERVRGDDMFSLRYHCGQLYFDRHRISTQIRGLTTYLLDHATKAATGDDTKTFKQGVKDVVDCGGLGGRAKDYYKRDVAYDGNGCPNPVSNLGGSLACEGIAEGIRKAVKGACEAAVGAGTTVLIGKLDAELTESAEINLQGVATSVRDYSISNGMWNGSMESGSFSGSFEMTKSN